MTRDRTTIDALRARHAIPHGLRIEHELPSEEPLLWIPDILLGAYGEAKTGTQRRWFAALMPRVSISHVKR